MTRYFRFAAVSLCVVGMSLAQSTARWGTVVFPSGASFGVELMVDPAARARGYMFRESISEREGMLFMFEESGHHGFWMKNCKVALDIIWLDENFAVVEIAHDQQPCPETGDCPSVAPMRAASYVLEVAAGTARRESLARGARLRFLSEGKEP